MNTKQLGVVECLDKDEVECCDQDVAVCLDQGVMKSLDKNNKDGFDVYFSFRTHWNSLLKKPWVCNVQSTMFI